jgi:chitodextrinase
MLRAASGAISLLLLCVACTHSSSSGPASPATDTTAPTVPTGLAATTVSIDRVSLSWNASNDNVGVTGYWVYRNDKALARTSSTAFTDTGLAPGSTYKYRVSAYDAVPNDSAWTQPALAVTTQLPPDTTPPSVPTGLRVTLASSNEIDLTWDASTDDRGAVAGYHVYLNGVILGTTTSTSFSHTGLSPNTTYAYRVSAYDPVPNESARSDPLSVTTQAAGTGATVFTAFSGTLADFPNPERGYAEFVENLTDVKSSWLASHRDSGYRVITHRQLLSDYWNVPTLPQSFLDALNAGAARHRNNGTKMIIQFSYDNVGGKPEPTLTTILGHIAQLKSFFEANADVIAGVHGGFLGLYGEWAFSSEPSIGNPTPTPAARAAVRDALLAVVPKDIQIGWRNVDDLMTWYPQPLTGALAFSGTDQARSGLHNDCFLSNPNDSGTYWSQAAADAGIDTGRTLSNPFRAYQANVSNWTTMGGENCDNGQYKACSDVLTDGPRYHWRYLRDDWGTVYRDGWKAQGCDPEISRSLGYRFQLDALSSPQSVPPGSVANVAVDLRNVGWSLIFSARKLVVTLQNRDTGALITGSAGDMRLLPAQAGSSTRIGVPVNVPPDAAPGAYDMYVSMPDIGPSTKDNAYYAVRFANADDSSKGQGWDAANFRFETGLTMTVGNAAP